MQDIPDEDLDDLFKQAAFYHRPPDTANAGWTAMQKKLDDDWIKIIYQRVKIFIAIELALLACIFFLLQNNGAFKSNDKVALDKKSNTEIKNQILNVEGKKKADILLRKINNSNEVSISDKKTEITETYKELINKNGEKIEKKSKMEKSIKEKQPLNNAQVEKIFIYKNVNETYKTGSSIKPLFPSKSNPNIELKKQNNFLKADIKNDHSFPNKPINQSNLTNTGIGLIKMKELPNRKDTIPTINKTLEIKNDTIPLLAKERNKDYKFNFTFLIAPDLSFTGLKNLNSVGSNIGVLLGYSFSKRFTMNTGFIYSTKVYSAKPSDYHPENNYWTSNKNIELYNVKGNCHVIDIPLNVRYNFLIKNKYNLYAVTGLSSYIMKKESYNYEYSYNYGPTANKDWEISNQNSHYFSIGNLSIGYERKISKKISLQAEPFIKLPLAGVGYGKVKLLSSGVFLSLKYNFK